MADQPRPIFHDGQRLTARQLNEAVEYLRTFLRRVLLAPLSPGVAVGLELSGTPMGTAANSITVAPGIAIDGRGRLLVARVAKTFDLNEVKNQIPDLFEDDLFRISLAIDERSTSFDPCSPELPLRAVEDVKLVFQKLPESSSRATVAMAPALAAPWDDVDPVGLSAEQLAVPLGHGIRSGETLAVSMDDRTGVIPRFSGLRNSFGDVAMVLDRRNGVGGLEITVPTVFPRTAPVVFQSTAGGPLTQAAILAKDVGQPPAGRIYAVDQHVFEAAGGRDTRPGISGVVAISMEYADEGANPEFPGVPHAGFPLGLSRMATIDPKVVPFLPNPGEAPPPLVGISAGPSYVDTNGRILVPVATAGLVLAWIDVPNNSSIEVGLELTPVAFAEGGQLRLRAALTGDLIVAKSAVRVTQPATPAQILVWVAPPYPKAPPAMT